MRSRHLGDFGNSYGAPPHDFAVWAFLDGGQPVNVFRFFSSLTTVGRSLYVVINLQSRRAGV